MVRKIEENSKITGIAVFLVLTLTFSMSLISSIGIANSYWDERPLRLAPGESMTISLRMQSDSGAPITIKAALDNPIATLVEGPEYIVQPGASVPANISIEIPEDADVGTKYTVYVSFEEVSSGEGGMLRLAQGITGKVPVEVVGEQESTLYGQTPKGNNLVWIVLGFIVLVAVLLIVRMNRRRQ